MHMTGTLRKEKERCQPDQASIHSIEDDQAQGSGPKGRSCQSPNGHGSVAMQVHTGLTQGYGTTGVQQPPEPQSPSVARVAICPTSPQHGAAWHCQADANGEHLRLQGARLREVLVHLGKCLFHRLCGVVGQACFLDQGVSALEQALTVQVVHNHLHAHVYLREELVSNRIEDNRKVCMHTASTSCKCLACQDQTVCMTYQVFGVLECECHDRPLQGASNDKHGKVGDAEIAWSRLACVHVLPVADTEGYMH